MNAELAAPIDDSNRTFHHDPTSEYYLPNDALEHARLDTQARHVSYIMKHRIIHSPLDQATVHQILDIGCGTGYVTEMLARQFPQADVFGLDLSAVPSFPQPPSNMHFLQGNILTQPATSWTSENNSTKKLSEDEYAFDFVFHRFLISGIEDWPRLINTDYSLLKAGGWAEVHDLDPSIYDAHNVDTTKDLDWFNKSSDASEARGIDYKCARRAQSWMKDAGFVDIAVKEYKIPLNSEGVEVAELQAAGAFFAPVMATVWKANIRRYVEQSKEDEDRMIAEVDKVVLSACPGHHMKIWVTVGRKPAPT